MFIYYLFMAALGLLQGWRGCGVLGGGRYFVVEVRGLPSAVAPPVAEHRL